jgi:peptidylprolyl isomerase
VASSRAVVLAVALLAACAPRGPVAPIVPPAPRFAAPIPPTDLPTQSLVSLDAIELIVGTGEEAAFQRCVYAHYTGWLTDGTKFDSSRDTTPRGTPREPISVPLGYRRVILGWDVGFDGMREGGQRRLIIPQQLAYGPLGRPPVIPPAATLIFDVELLAVRDTLPRNPGAPAPGCAPWNEVAPSVTR